LKKCCKEKRRIKFIDQAVKRLNQVAADGWVCTEVAFDIVHEAISGKGKEKGKRKF